MNEIEKLEGKISNLEEQLNLVLTILVSIADEQLNGVDISTNDRAALISMLQSNGLYGY